MTATAALGLTPSPQGSKLMMMGTADAAPVAPTTAVVFVEDLPDAERAKASMARPSNYSVGAL